jgi:Phosphodiester glycosidase
MHFISASITFFITLATFLFGKEGIEYSKIEMPYCFGYQDIHVIECNPELFQIKAVKAIDNGIGRENVLSLAKRHKAVAAINAGFFSIGKTLDGKAAGALKIHTWYGIPLKPRGCIGWSIKNKKPIFDRLLICIEGGDNYRSFSVDGLNRERKKGEMILFNPAFNNTTLTYPDGEEIIIQNDIIANINQECGSSKIPKNGYVLSIQKDHTLYGSFKVGTHCSFNFNIKPQEGFTNAEDWENCDYIIGGTPLLIYDHSKIVDFSSERTISTFLSYRHARTAIGILPNGNWLFVVVDKIGLTDGMTMDELTDLMGSFNCKYALNLDGGGSSTCIYENEIKNTPYGDEDEDLKQKTVRRVSDAIVVIQETKSIK